MSFTSDLSQFRLKVEKNLEQTYRATSISLFKRVILKTPVDSGRLAANWQADIAKPAIGTTFSVDPSKSKTIEQATETALKANLNQSLFLVNNLPYAPSIENGSSKQAPEGMVKSAISDFKREVETQAKKVNK